MSQNVSIEACLCGCEQECSCVSLEAFRKLAMANLSPDLFWGSADRNDYFVVSYVGRDLAQPRTCWPGPQYEVEGVHESCEYQQDGTYFCTHGTHGTWVAGASGLPPDPATAAYHFDGTYTTPDGGRGTWIHAGCAGSRSVAQQTGVQCRVNADGVTFSCTNGTTGSLQEPFGDQNGGQNMGPQSNPNVHCSYLPDGTYTCIDGTTGTYTPSSPTAPAAPMTNPNSQCELDQFGRFQCDDGTCGCPANAAFGAPTSGCTFDPSGTYQCPDGSHGTWFPKNAGYLQGGVPGDLACTYNADGTYSCPDGSTGTWFAVQQGGHCDGDVANSGCTYHANGTYHCPVTSPTPSLTVAPLAAPGPSSGTPSTPASGFGTYSPDLNSSYGTYLPYISSGAPPPPSPSGNCSYYPDGSFVCDDGASGYWTAPAESGSASPVAPGAPLDFSNCTVLPDNTFVCTNGVAGTLQDPENVVYDTHGQAFVPGNNFGPLHVNQNVYCWFERTAANQLSNRWYCSDGSSGTWQSTSDGFEGTPDRQSCRFLYNGTFQCSDGHTGFWGPDGPELADLTQVYNNPNFDQENLFVQKQVQGYEACKFLTDGTFVCPDGTTGYWHDLQSQAGGSCYYFRQTMTYSCDDGRQGIWRTGVPAGSTEEPPPYTLLGGQENQYDLSRCTFVETANPWWTRPLDFRDEGTFFCNVNENGSYRHVQEVQHTRTSWEKERLYALNYTDVDTAGQAFANGALDLYVTGGDRALELIARGMAKVGTLDLTQYDLKRKYWHSFAGAPAEDIEAWRDYWQYTPEYQADIDRLPPDLLSYWDNSPLQPRSRDPLVYCEIADDEKTWNCTRKEQVLGSMEQRYFSFIAHMDADATRTGDVPFDPEACAYFVDGTLVCQTGETGSWERVYIYDAAEHLAEQSGPLANGGVYGEPDINPLNAPTTNAPAIKTRPEDRPVSIDESALPADFSRPIFPPIPANTSTQAYIDSLPQELQEFIEFTYGRSNVPQFQIEALADGSDYALEKAIAFYNRRHNTYYAVPYVDAETGESVSQTYTPLYEGNYYNVTPVDPEDDQWDGVLWHIPDPHRRPKAYVNWWNALVKDDAFEAHRIRRDLLVDPTTLPGARSDDRIVLADDIFFTPWNDATTIPDPWKETFLKNFKDWGEENIYQPQLGVPLREFLLSPWDVNSIGFREQGDFEKQVQDKYDYYVGKPLANFLGVPYKEWGTAEQINRWLESPYLTETERQGFEHLLQNRLEYDAKVNALTLEEKDAIFRGESTLLPNADPYGLGGEGFPDTIWEYAAYLWNRPSPIQIFQSHDPDAPYYRESPVPDLIPDGAFDDESTNAPGPVLEAPFDEASGPLDSDGFLQELDKREEEEEDSTVEGFSSGDGTLNEEIPAPQPTFAAPEIDAEGNPVGPNVIPIREPQPGLNAPSLPPTDTDDGSQ